MQGKRVNARPVTEALEEVEDAVSRVLRSEHNHFAQLWDDAPHAQRQLMLALANEPSQGIYSSDYHSRHELPTNPTLQTALAGLTKKELVGRNADAEYCLIEPFLAEWLKREQREYTVSAHLRGSQQEKRQTKRKRNSGRRRPSS